MEDGGMPSRLPWLGWNLIGGFMRRTFSLKMLQWRLPVLVCPKIILGFSFLPFPSSIRGVSDEVAVASGCLGVNKAFSALVDGCRNSRVVTSGHNPLVFGNHSLTYF